MSERAHDKIISKFKENHSLTDRDIRILFNISIEQSNDWIAGRNVPDSAKATALFLDNLLYEIEKEKGRFTDNDYYHLLKHCTTLDSQITGLRELVQRLREKLPLETSEEYKLDQSNREFDQAVREAIETDKAHVALYSSTNVGVT